MSELIQEIEVRRAKRALSEKKIPKPESEVICYNVWEFSASN
jgi:hypothetical protein